MFPEQSAATRHPILQDLTKARGPGLGVSGSLRSLGIASCIKYTSKRLSHEHQPHLRLENRHNGIQHDDYDLYTVTQTPMHGAMHNYASLTKRHGRNVRQDVCRDEEIRVTLITVEVGISANSNFDRHASCPSFPRTTSSTG